MNITIWRIEKSITETLAPYEKLALHSLTEEELETIKVTFEKIFPKEEFSAIYETMWQTYIETKALQIHRLIEAKYPGSSNEGRRAITWFTIVKPFPFRLQRSEYKKYVGKQEKN